MWPANRDAFEEFQSLANEGATKMRRAGEVDLQIFELDWLTCDAIIVCLSRYMKLFFSQKAVGELTKHKLAHDSTNLFNVLINLPMKPDAQSARSGHSSSVTADLNFGTRSQIVSRLLANHTLLDHVKSANLEFRMKAVKHNNALIFELINLFGK